MVHRSNSTQHLDTSTADDDVPLYRLAISQKTNSSTIVTESSSTSTSTTSTSSSLSLTSSTLPVPLLDGVSLKKVTRRSDRLSIDATVEKLTRLRNEEFAAKQKAIEKNQNTVTNHADSNGENSEFKEPKAVRNGKSNSTDCVQIVPCASNKKDTETESSKEDSGKNSPNKRVKSSIEDSKPEPDLQFEEKSAEPIGIVCSLPLDRLTGIIDILQKGQYGVKSIVAEKSIEIEIPSKDTILTGATASRTLCLYCDRSFSSHNLYIKHAERIHQAAEGRRLSARNLNVSSLLYPGCSHCNSGKITSLPSDELPALFEHLVDIHFDKYFACKPCTIRFYTKDLLQLHLDDLHQNVILNQQIFSTITDATNSKPLKSTSTVYDKRKKKSLKSTAPITQTEEADANLSHSLSSRVVLDQVSVEDELPTVNTSATTDTKATSEEPYLRSSRRQQAKFIAATAKTSPSLQQKTKILPQEDAILSRLGIAQNRSPRTRRGIKNQRTTPTTDSIRSETPSIRTVRTKNTRSTITNNIQGNSSGMEPIDINPLSTTRTSVGNKAEVPCGTFDENFYESVNQNVRQNLTCHIDGKLESGPTSPSPISLPKAEPAVRSTLVKSPLVSDSEIHEATSLATITAFPTLLTAQQYGTEPMPSGKIKKPITKNSWKWKWDCVKKYKYVNEGGKVVKKIKQPIAGLRDLSKLDMWTQLTMRTKHEERQRQEIELNGQEQNLTVGEAAREEKRKLIEQLNGILDRRILPQINLEQNDQRIIKLENSSEEENSPETVADSIQPTSHGLMSDDLLSILCLNRVDQSAANTQSKVILSGEWARPRCYICFGCGDKFETIKSLDDHQVQRHPYVYSTHYEIVGKELIEGNLFRHFYIPSAALQRHNEYVRRNTTMQQQQQVQTDRKDNILMEDSMDSIASFSASISKSDSFDTDSNSRISKTSHSTTSFTNSTVSSSDEVPVANKKSCTKCNRVCNGLVELYRHMLDCSGDYAWQLAKKRIKYRYFGSRRRRVNRANAAHRRPVIRPKKEEDGSSPPRTTVKGPSTPRPRPSDAESIQRMLANLPAKRACRQIFPNLLQKRTRKIIAANAAALRNGHKQLLIKQNGKNSRNLQYLTAKQSINKKLSLVRRRSNSPVSFSRTTRSSVQNGENTEIGNEPIKAAKADLLKSIKRRTRHVVNQITSSFRHPVHRRGLRSVSLNTEKIVSTNSSLSLRKRRNLVNNEKKSEQKRSEENKDLEKEADDMKPSDKVKKKAATEPIDIQRKNSTRKSLIRRALSFRKSRRKNVEQEKEVDGDKKVEEQQLVKEESKQNDPSEEKVTNDKKDEKKRGKTFKNFFKGIKKNCRSQTSTPTKSKEIPENDIDENESIKSKNKNPKEKTISTEKGIIENKADLKEINVIEDKTDSLEKNNDQVEESLKDNTQNVVSSAPEIPNVETVSNENTLAKTDSVQQPIFIAIPGQMIDNQPTTSSTTTEPIKTPPFGRKRTRKLNDCIAMLTGKLQEKLGVPFLENDSNVLINSLTSPKSSIHTAAHVTEENDDVPQDLTKKTLTEKAKMEETESKDLRKDEKCEDLRVEEKSKELELENKSNELMNDKPNEPIKSPQLDEKQNQTALVLSENSEPIIDKSSPKKRSRRKPVFIVESDENKIENESKQLDVEKEVLNEQNVQSNKEKTEEIETVEKTIVEIPEKEEIHEIKNKEEIDKIKVSDIQKTTFLLDESQNEVVDLEIKEICEMKKSSITSKGNEDKQQPPTSTEVKVISKSTKKVQIPKSKTTVKSKSKTVSLVEPKPFDSSDEEELLPWDPEIGFIHLEKSPEKSEKSPQPKCSNVTNKVDDPVANILENVKLSPKADDNNKSITEIDKNKSTKSENKTAKTLTTSKTKSTKTSNKQSPKVVNLVKKNKEKIETVKPSEKPSAVTPPPSKASPVLQPKQRKKRKNELAQIIADQLLESFKEVDQSRIEELKLLHDLSIESNSDDILLTTTISNTPPPKRKTVVNISTDALIDLDKSFDESELNSSVELDKNKKSKGKVKGNFEKDNLLSSKSVKTQNQSQVKKKNGNKVDIDNASQETIGQSPQTNCSLKDDDVKTKSVNIRNRKKSFDDSSIQCQTTPFVASAGKIRARRKTVFYEPSPKLIKTLEPSKKRAINHGDFNISNISQGDKFELKDKKKKSVIESIVEKETVKPPLKSLNENTKVNKKVSAKSVVKLSETAQTDKVEDNPVPSKKVLPLIKAKNIKDLIEPERIDKNTENSEIFVKPKLSPTPKINIIDGITKKKAIVRLQNIQIPENGKYPIITSTPALIDSSCPPKDLPNSNKEIVQNEKVNSDNLESSSSKQGRFAKPKTNPAIRKDAKSNVSDLVAQIISDFTTSTIDSRNSSPIVFGELTKTNLDLFNKTSKLNEKTGALLGSKDNLGQVKEITNFSKDNKGTSKSDVVLSAPKEIPNSAKEKINLQRTLAFRNKSVENLIQMDRIASIKSPIRAPFMSPRWEPPIFNEDFNAPIKSATIPDVLLKEPVLQKLWPTRNVDDPAPNATTASTGTTSDKPNIFQNVKDKTKKLFGKISKRKNKKPDLLSTKKNILPQSGLTSSTKRPLLRPSILSAGNLFSGISSASGISSGGDMANSDGLKKLESNSLFIDKSLDFGSNSLSKIFLNEKPIIGKKSVDVVGEVDLTTGIDNLFDGTKRQENESDKKSKSSRFGLFTDSSMTSKLTECIQVPDGNSERKEKKIEETGEEKDGNKNVNKNKKLKTKKLRRNQKSDSKKNQSIIEDSIDNGKKPFNQEKRSTKSSETSQCPAITDNARIPNCETSQDTCLSDIVNKIRDTNQQSESEEDLCLAAIAKSLNNKIMNSDEFNNEPDSPPTEPADNNKFSQQNTNLETLVNLTKESIIKDQKSTTNATDTEINSPKQSEFFDQDENTNTELIDMDLEDCVSVYTSFSMDTSITSSGGTKTKRKRRTRKSINLKSSRKSKKSGDQFLTPSETYFCDICVKTFRSPGGLSTHKMTLTHISRLSEQEFLQSKAKQNEENKSDKEPDIEDEPVPIVSMQTESVLIEQPLTDSTPIIQTAEPEPVQSAPIPIEPTHIEPASIDPISPDQTLREELPPVSVEEAAVPVSAKDSLATEQLDNSLPILGISSTKDQPFNPIVSPARSQPMSYLNQCGIEPISSPEQMDFTYDRYASITMARSSVLPASIENSRLALSQEERLFYECCSMLKGSDRTLPVSGNSPNKYFTRDISTTKPVTPKSNEQYSSYLTPDISAKQSKGIPKIDINQFSDISSDSNPAFSCPQIPSSSETQNIFSGESHRNQNKLYSIPASNYDKMITGKENQHNSIKSINQIYSDVLPIGRRYPPDEFSDMGDSFPSSQDASESENYIQTILKRSNKNRVDLSPSHRRSEYPSVQGKESPSESGGNQSNRLAGLTQIALEQHVDGKMDLLRSPMDSPLHSTSSQSSTMSKPRTKAAMKGFENFKVSIPTTGLDMQQALNRSPNSSAGCKLAALADIALGNDVPHAVGLMRSPCMDVMPSINCFEKEKTVHKNEIKLQLSDGDIPLRTSKRKEQMGNALGFKQKKKMGSTRKPRAGVGKSSKPIESVASKDVYDFDDSGESLNEPIISLSETRSKTVEAEILKKDEDLDQADSPASTYSDRDDFNYDSVSESESSGNESHTSVVTSKSVKSINNVQKKCLIMGRIFKAAKKAEATNGKPTTTAKKPIPKQELDKLFDSLRGAKKEKTSSSATDKNDSEKVEKDVHKSNSSRPTSTNVSEKNEKMRRMGGRRCRKPREIANLEAEWGMSMDQIIELIGVGQRKTQRRCAANKQRTFAETWSSDEYEDFHSTRDIIALVQEAEVKANRAKSRGAKSAKKNPADVQKNDSTKKSDGMNEPDSNDTSAKTEAAINSEHSKVVDKGEDITLTDKNEVKVDDNSEKAILNDEKGTVNVDNRKNKSNVKHPLPSEELESTTDVRKKVNNKEKVTKETDKENKQISKTKQKDDEKKKKTKQFERLKNDGSKTQSTKTTATVKPKKSTTFADIDSDETDFDSEWSKTVKRSRIKKRRRTIAFREDDLKSSGKNTNDRDRSSSKPSKQRSMVKSPIENENPTDEQMAGIGIDTETTTPSPELKPMARRKRVASEMLYYWSSSSDEEFGRIKPRENYDDGNLEQHGWIVGDSHKKLVTLLAHAKGKKIEDCGVKEAAHKKKS